MNPPNKIKDEIVSNWREEIVGCHRDDVAIENVFSCTISYDENHWQSEQKYG